MAHMQKFKGSAATHIIGHCEREKGEEGYLKYRNNSYIDDERTPLNYAFVTDGHDRLKKRLEEIAPSRRKDAVTMVDWVVTLPEQLIDTDRKEQDRFFEITERFLENRYGLENVVASTVHLDETTPHLHFCFVPVVTDKKTGKEKLCCKELMTKAELNRFHRELDKTMTAEFGIEGLILNGVTKETGGNKSVAQLKAKTLADSVEKVKSDLLPVQEKINAEIEKFRSSNTFYFLTGLINERGSTSASRIFTDCNTYYFQDIKVKRNGILMPASKIDDYLAALPYLEARDIIAEKTDSFMKAMETYCDFDPLEKYQEIRVLHQRAEADRKQAAAERERYEKLAKEQETLNEAYRSVCNKLNGAHEENRQLQKEKDRLKQDNDRQQRDIEYYMKLTNDYRNIEEYYTDHYGFVSQHEANFYCEEKSRKERLERMQPSIRRTNRQTIRQRSRQKEKEDDLQL